MRLLDDLLTTGDDKMERKDTGSGADQVIVRETVHEDLPSLSTLHIRAFNALEHNKWHRMVFPDTPVVRKWWSSRYAASMADPKCITLKATTTDSPHDVLGLLCMSKMDAGELGAGGWTTFARSVDHPKEPYEDCLRLMVEAREKHMVDRPHYLLEHFGIDAQHQKRGLGGRMIAAACSHADENGADIFVEANEFAAPFYVRNGFAELGREPVVGGMDEVFLVRYAKEKP